MNLAQMKQWLRTLSGTLTPELLGKLLYLLLVVLIALALIRLVRGWIDREVEDVNRRHRFRKVVGYVGGLFVVVFGFALLGGALGNLATVFAIIGAGLALAFQDLAKSAAGWLYLIGQRGLGPGARIEVDGIVGEIVDVGVLKTTVLEVGNLVYGRQSSGRLASIPNSHLLGQSVLFTTDFSPFAWNEVQFLLTYESDWRRGKELLEGFAREVTEDIEPETERAFRELERRYAFKYGALTPIVYVAAADSGVQLTLRYLTHIRRRRGSADHITRRMLEAVEREPRLEFAYPTWRTYRRGEEGEGGERHRPPAGLPEPGDAGSDAG